MKLCPTDEPYISIDVALSPIVHPFSCCDHRIDWLLLGSLQCFEYDKVGFSAANLPLICLIINQLDDS